MPSCGAFRLWENDLSAPDVSLLLPLAELLGVTTDALLGNRLCLAGPGESDCDGFCVL